MATMPMFPLGSVLFPHMPLRLQVFEERYLIMLSDLLKADQDIFGVVLIERGREVGGGEHRFSLGTTAEIMQLRAQEGSVGLLAQGQGRFEVVEWLSDDPHPRAEVTQMPELIWDEGDRALLKEAEWAVRRTLAAASEFGDTQWPADIELSDDPVAAAWQLAGIAPVGPLDQLNLLRSPTCHDLLTKTVELATAAAIPFTEAWPATPGDGEES